MQVRFRTGFVYIAVSVLCALASDWTTLALLVATAGITAGEFYYMLRSDAKLPNEMLGIIAAMLYPVSVFVLGLTGALYVSLALLLALIVWYVFWMRARVPDVGVSFFGAAYTRHAALGHRRGAHRAARAVGRRARAGHLPERVGERLVRLSGGQQVRQAQAGAAHQPEEELGGLLRGACGLRAVLVPPDVHPGR